MFIHKTLVAAALLVGMGRAYSVAQNANKPKVAPMTQSDRKITKCELHGDKLHTEDVRISYGLIRQPEGYYEASKQFPHSNTRVMGGCVISPDAPRLRTVKFCDDCRKAEKQWLDAHQIKR
ncbi:hypothetical protein EON83_08635 [bacterium]|nr:MAG: hypothetical protein EON83_08635 [bacterium]